MPCRNAVKSYVPGGTYHAYNRGVEKREIFLDGQDYAVFLRYLKTYLVPPDHPSQKDLPFGTTRALQMCDLWRRVQLLAYCLMPNHFHLVLKQTDDKGMTEFLRRLSNAYVEYFNKKHARVGALFQGRYKAVLVEGGGHFLLLTRYVHRNPLELLAAHGSAALADYPYSSYSEYLGMRKTEWLRSDEILQYFPEVRKSTPGILTYREFVEDAILDEPKAIGTDL